MDAFKEIWSSLIERVRNPFVSSFVISWCVINFKLLIVLVANEPYTDKFAYIESLMYVGGSSGPWYFLGFPLITFRQLVIFPAIFSLIYVFILPFIGLASTWATSYFELLHSNIRIYMLKKMTLTAEQRDQFQREYEFLIEKAQKEARDAIAARLDTSDTTRKNISILFKSMLPSIFEKLQREAPNWKKEEGERPQDANEVECTAEQKDFLVNYGIPKQWAKLFKVMKIDEKINPIETANLLKVNEDDALAVLVNLSALALLNFEWVDNTAYFSMSDGLWVQKLNGRPA